MTVCIIFSFLALSYVPFLRVTLLSSEKEITRNFRASLQHFVKYVLFYVIELDVFTQFLDYLRVLIFLVHLFIFPYDDDHHHHYHAWNSRTGSEFFKLSLPSPFDFSDVFSFPYTNCDILSVRITYDLSWILRPYVKRKNMTFCEPGRGVETC